MNNPIKILLVEDDPVDVELVTSYLARTPLAGARFEHADRLATARKRIAEDRPDVILLDLSLPDTRGLHTVAHVIEAAPDVPIIIMTGQDDDATAVAAMKLGAQDFLVKGRFREHELARTITHAMERQHLTTALAAAVRARESEIQELKVLRSESERLKTTLDRMAEGAQIIGRDWKYIYVNDEAARQGLRTKEELLGRTIMEQYPGIDQTPLFASLRRCMVEGVSEHFENQFTFPDGTAGWFDLSLQPLPEGVFILSTDITQRKQDEAALRGSEAKLRTLFEVLPVGISILDKQRRVIENNPALERISGMTREGLAQGSYAGNKYFHPDGTPLQPNELPSARAFAEQRVIQNVEMAVITEAGKATWVNVSAAPMPMADLGVVVVTTDITERKRIEAALANERDLLQALMDSVPDTIYFKDTASRFTRVNRAQAAVLGVSDPEQAVGKTDADFQSGELATGFSAEEQALFQSGQPVINRVEYNPTPEGEPRWFSATKMPLRDTDGRITGMVGISRDITAYKQLEDQLRHIAGHDALTGLPNRALLMDRLTQAFERARRHPEHHFAALYLDLDLFKSINDSLGHPAGDQVLIAAAQRLQEALRADDTVGRLGGDEFVLLLDGMVDGRDVLRVTERIQQSIARAIRAEGQEVFTTASIGVALSGPEYQQAEDLLRDADAALYRAKKLGRGRTIVFDADLHQRALQLLEMESDLRRAAAHDEFVLHYQPIVALATGRVSGFEALLRWRHPVRGLLLPNDFLKIAEETGVLNLIGPWLLRHACRQAQAWQARTPAKPLTISVNLSTSQFAQADLVEQVAEALAQSGLASRQLCLEITEGAISDLPAAARTLQRLHDLGVKLHLDDFGTGYSSLSRLHDLPIDLLKVDGSFARRMSGPAGKNEPTIVRTIILLARELGLAVTAEGIETVEHEALFKTLGCDFGQGYWYSRPIEADAASRFWVQAAE